MLRPFAFAFVLLAGASVLRGQETLELDLSHRCDFGGGPGEAELYAFNSGSAVMDNLVAQILELGGGQEQNFTLIQTNVESVTALVVGDKRYLLWSQDFLLRASRLQAYASVAHAIGHLVSGHTLDKAQQAVEEPEANAYMGFVLCRARQFQDRDLPNIFHADGGYAFSHDWNGYWLKAARQGYKQSEIGLKLGSAAFDNDPSLTNFLKAAFPFPPPPCYQQTELADWNFSGCSTLGQVAQRIGQALNSRQYSYRYLSAPDGFAIVTQLEQYRDDGSVLLGDPNRWKEVPPQESFALTISYLQSLFFPRKAHLRTMVFLVTRQNFSSAGQRIDKETAKDWFNQAVNRLPRSIANAPFTPDHAVDVLVYEFEVPEANNHAAQQCPCHLRAEDHLARSGISIRN